MTLVALILAVFALALNWIGYMAFRHLAARATATERRLAELAQGHDHKLTINRGEAGS